MADNKPATVMEKKVKGTTYVVSSFFNTAAKETIFDKLQHTAECDADIAASKRKYQGFKSIKNFTRQIGYGIIKP